MAFTNLSDLVACVSSSSVPPSSTSKLTYEYTIIDAEPPRAPFGSLPSPRELREREEAKVRATPQTIPGVGAVPVREDGIRIVGVYNSDRLVGKDGRVTSMRQDWLLSGGLDQSGAKRFSTSALDAAKAEPKVGTCRRCGLPSCMHPRAG